MQYVIIQRLQENIVYKMLKYDPQQTIVHKQYLCKVDPNIPTVKSLETYRNDVKNENWEKCLSKSQKNWTNKLTVTK